MNVCDEWMWYGVDVVCVCSSRQAARGRDRPADRTTSFFVSLRIFFTMACEHRRSGQSRVLGLIRFKVVQEASLRHFQVLTIPSETVTGSSEISPRRDQHAVV